MAVRTWEVPSDSRPGVAYTVTLFLDQHYAMKPGSFSCTCAAWKFQRRATSERACKHVVYVQGKMRSADKEFGAIREIRGSEISFNEEAVESGRLRGLINAIIAMNQ